MSVRICSLVAVLNFLLPALATAQVDPLPMPGPLESIQPTSGVSYPKAEFRVADDAYLYPEAGHPPFDQIPPMPMPDSDTWRPDDRAPSTTLFHDAKTGLTVESPPTRLSGATSGRSPEPTYQGVGKSSTDRLMRTFSNMTVAADLPGWPRRANVKMFMRFTTTGGTTLWYTCSGSMADAGVVQTAAHCVYGRNPDGNNIFNWANEIYIYPAWDGVGTEWAAPGSTEVIQHFGYVRATQYMAGSNWVTDGSFDADNGAVRIARGSSRNIGMLTGWFGWAWGGTCPEIQARVYSNFSYPAEGCSATLHTGRTMYYWAGSYDSCPGNQLQINTTGGCLNAGWGGMSGSGAYYIDGDSRYVQAVSSNSERSTVARYARLWETWVIDRTTFVNDTRSASFDLEALRFRADGSTVVTAGTSMSAGSRVYIANATNNDPAPDSYQLRIYLSTNNIISSGDTLLGTWNYNVDFAAMQGTEFLVPAVAIPLSTPGGSYWIGGLLDPATDGVSANSGSSLWDAQAITVRSQNLFRNGFES